VAMMEKTYGQLDNIQSMIDSIETAKMNAEIFSALKEGKEALKTLNDLISISDVEELLDGTFSNCFYFLLFIIYYLLFF
jgi:hypothetical protein